MSSFVSVVRHPRARLLLLFSAATAISACDAERSSTPLSPNIAGPLAGVTITAPAAAGPAITPLLRADEQPITLTFTDATSNSVRPFTYELQIATDPQFTQIVVSITGIEPNESGQVVVQPPDTLEADKVYYWRVRAVDGANTGPYSDVRSFELYTPVTIAAPVINGPTGGETTPSNVVTLVAANAVITGPAESVRYRFDLSQDPGFGNAEVLTVNQSTGASTAASPGGPLPYETTYYWRVRVFANARNGEVSSDWSATASFRTPEPPVVITAPTPTSPINGATVATSPTLTVANGTVTGNAGTVTYQFVVDDNPSFATPESTFSVTRSGSGSTLGLVPVSLTPGQQFYWRARGTNGTITSSWSATATFLTAANLPPGPTPPPGPAAPPAPNPGGQLPLPDMSGLVNQVAAQNPGLLANSCQDHGGTWEFMDLLVAQLRQVDGRWGYNCKRGDCGDVSQDVVDYHWGSGSPQGSTEVYIIDVIGGHCGSGPSPAWIDQTAVTAQAGTIGRWTFPR